MVEASRDKSDQGKTRVVLVDDHQLVREGLRALLSGQDDIEVVGEAADGHAALAVVAELAPQVVILDASLPGLDGVETLRRLRAEHHELLVLMLSMHDDPLTVDRALRAGARGYVLKGAGVEAVCQAIRAARRGDLYLSPGISDYVVKGYLRAGEDGVDPLSPREREVLMLIAEGFTGREIAARLGLKPKTVENHRGRLMEKLDIHTTAGLVRHALRVGLVSD
jgi:DNA-binding NarL/FixJ family response regulator